MSRRRTVVVALLAAAVGVGGCVGWGEEDVEQSGVMGANAQVGDVLLLSVHVEAPRHPRYPVGADARLWFTIVNEADRPDTLTSITSPAASRVEIWWDDDCDGDPQRVPRLPLRPVRPNPAATETGIPPFDAYSGHVVDFNREVLAGTTIEVVFEFARAGRVAVDAYVQPSNAPRAEPSLRCVAQPVATGGAP